MAFSEEMHMAAISRREFFRKVAMDVAVTGFLATSATELHANPPNPPNPPNPLGLPIGSQTCQKSQQASALEEIAPG